MSKLQGPSIQIFISNFKSINIQIKIAMSKDKLRILFKILAESHMAFDWEIKSTFDAHGQTDQP